MSSNKDLLVSFHFPKKPSCAGTKILFASELKHQTLAKSLMHILNPMQPTPIPVQVAANLIAFHSSIYLCKYPV